MRPFSEREVALLENFAAQAVIAMENARLLTETREALEQQTATAEVLQVINSSPGNLTPVFDAMLDKSTRFVARRRLPFDYDGEHLRAVATRGCRNVSRRWFASPSSVRPCLRTLIDSERLLYVRTLGRWESKPEGPTRFLVDAFARTAWRYRFEGRRAPRPDLRRPSRSSPVLRKEIALLENFAAQAVIAMENARLITEQEALEQQTATAEVCR